MGEVYPARDAKARPYRHGDRLLSAADCDWRAHAVLFLTQFRHIRAHSS